MSITERDINTAALYVRAMSDDRLSYEALGMLSRLLSLPGGTATGIEALCRRGTARQRAYRIVKELIAADYVARKYLYDYDNRRVSWVEYCINDNWSDE